MSTPNSIFLQIIVTFFFNGCDIKKTPYQLHRPFNSILHISGRIRRELEINFVSLQPNRLHQKMWSTNLSSIHCEPGHSELSWNLKNKLVENKEASRKHVVNRDGKMFDSKHQVIQTKLFFLCRFFLSNFISRKKVLSYFIFSRTPFVGTFFFDSTKTSRRFS